MRLYGALIGIFILFASVARAQTPNPVTPGYQICSSTSGSTQCSFQPTNTSSGLPVQPDASSGLNVGTAGAPAADVVTVQSPITSGSAGYPAGSTPITGNAQGTTGAVVGTLAGVANKTTYICGFHIDATGTGAIGPITIAGLTGSNMVYQGTAGAAQSPNQVFTPCIPASAQNTAITVTTTADGTATAVDVNSWGFQQ